ncbi:3-keto-5-aminohexanoate cleavage enzyme [Sinosporangium album]|uniref:3-keto-5-aminohexanoate cleavage enzyme n=1 Tax=Sinosporangium album TaxID=504805 RepID=A0A1G7ZV25_9ACTN|nr:3-keto-5-aminohexanoate cleavage protein [Sinosporangium album]SDH12555.1 3-keto-5-aminohexanoate cleavage enzyme [Sinosporangium album]
MLDLTQDFRTLPSRMALKVARGSRDMDSPPPPDVQPPWDIPDVVAVTAAVSGRIVRESTDPSDRYAQDYESFVDAAVASIEAGACGVHIDFGGLPAIQDSGLTVEESYQKLIPAITERVGRDWVVDANILRGDNFAENMFPITSGLAETAPMASSHPVEWMEAAAHLVTERGGRVMFSIHSAAEVELAERLVLSKNILPTPTCWIILIGYPYTEASDRLATYLKHPKAMMFELIQIVDRIKEIDAGAFIQVCAAGRAGHYLATTAMLLGLHVRVGTEDSAFRYPHRDDLVTDSAEMVRRAAATAETLGRRLATPDELRALIGMRPKGMGTG